MQHKYPIPVHGSAGEWGFFLQSDGAALRNGDTFKELVSLGIICVPKGEVSGNRGALRSEE